MRWGQLAGVVLIALCVGIGGAASQEALESPGVPRIIERSPAEEEQAPPIAEDADQQPQETIAPEVGEAALDEAQNAQTEADEAQEYLRQNAVAQQRIAEATEKLGRLARWQTLVAAATAMFLVCTLIATVVTARAATKNASAARESNRLAAERFEKQFDPYIFIESIESTPRPDSRFNQAKASLSKGFRYIRITVKNGSQWPAFIKRRGVYTYYILDGELLRGLGGDEHGGTVELKAGKTMPIEFSWGESPSKHGGREDVFNRIRIIYDTVQGMRRTKSFWLTRVKLSERPSRWRYEEVNKPSSITEKELGTPEDQQPD